MGDPRSSEWAKLPGGETLDAKASANVDFDPWRNSPAATDASSVDTDGDCVPDGIDLCPGTAPHATVDANGWSDAQVDGDHDGICDPGAPSAGPSHCTGSDNCPATPNHGQQDFDRDGIGDACDVHTGPPVDKDQCKDNGWKRFDVPRKFKNQGDCVSYVEAHKDDGHGNGHGNHNDAGDDRGGHWNWSDHHWNWQH